MNINRPFSLLVAVLALIWVSLPFGVEAQWSIYDTQPSVKSDTVVRPGRLTFVVSDTDCTTTTLTNATGTLVVDRFDLYTGTPTYVPAASIHDEYLHQPRRLAFYVKDNSTFTMKGYVTVTGTSQWGRQVSDQIQVNAGTQGHFAVTSHAYASITGISLNLTNVASSSDVLTVGLWGYGICANTTALLAQYQQVLSLTGTVSGTTSTPAANLAASLSVSTTVTTTTVPTAYAGTDTWSTAVAGTMTGTATITPTWTLTDFTTATGVWNSNYQTWYKSTASTVGDLLSFQWYSTQRADPQSGSVGPIVALSGQTYQSGINYSGFGYLP